MVAIISLHSVSPSFVSIVYAVQGSDLTSYPNPMSAISPYSVGQSNQLYQTPLLTLGTNPEESSGQDSSETASISSVSTTAPSSSPSPLLVLLLLVPLPQEQTRPLQLLHRQKHLQRHPRLREQRKIHQYVTIDYTSPSPTIRQ